MDSFRFKKISHTNTVERGSGLTSQLWWFACPSVPLSNYANPRPRSNPILSTLHLHLCSWEWLEKNTTTLEVLTSSSWPNRPSMRLLTDGCKRFWCTSTFHCFTLLFPQTLSVSSLSLLLSWCSCFRRKLAQSPRHHVNPPLSIVTHLLLPVTQFSPACVSTCALEPFLPPQKHYLGNSSFLVYISCSLCIG